MSDAPPPDMPHSQPGGSNLRDPSSMCGAVMAAVVGGLIVWMLMTIVPHIHIYWR